MLINIIDQLGLVLEFSESQITSALQKLNELSTEIKLVEVYLDRETEWDNTYSTWLKVYIDDVVMVREGRAGSIEASVDLAIKKMLKKHEVNL